MLCMFTVDGKCKHGVYDKLLLLMEERILRIQLVELGKRINARLDNL